MFLISKIASAMGLSTPLEEVSADRKMEDIGGAMWMRKMTVLTACKTQACRFSAGHTRHASKVMIIEVRSQCSSTFILGPCECNTFGLKRFRSQETCMTDIFDDDKFCYVPLESRCKDKRASKFFPSVYWSMKACAGIVSMLNHIQGMNFGF